LPLVADQLDRKGGVYYDWITPPFGSRETKYVLTLQAISTQDGKIRWSIPFASEGPGVLTAALSLSGDGTRAVVELSDSMGASDSLALIDIAKGKLLWRRPIRTACARLDANGTTIAAFSLEAQPKLVFLDARDGSLKRTITTDVQNAYSIGFSEDGNRVAVGYHDRSIRIFDASNRSTTLKIEGSKGLPGRFVFLSGNRLIVFDDQSASLWDLDKVVSPSDLHGSG
jgi:WD40 repeat protein